MFQRICAVAMFVAALFISVIPNADARQDIYAFTYNGNNWYVDRDSIDRSKPDGLLHFTVYTMIGLRYVWRAVVSITTLMYIITIKNCLPKVVSYYIATQVSWRRLVWHVNNRMRLNKHQKPVVAQQIAITIGSSSNGGSICSANGTETQYR